MSFKTIKHWFQESLDGLFGLISMITILAVLAVIPILNLISLGYLIQMGANVSKHGRWREGFAGVKNAAIFGRIALGAWLCLWPCKFLLELKMAAELTDPNGDRVKLFGTLFTLLLFLAVLHIFWASLRGGKLRHFIWPAPLKLWRWLKQTHQFGPILANIKTTCLDIPLKSLFWLGLRAFVGALIWLALPIGLIIFASFLPPKGLFLSLPAGFALMWVILHLPFLQLQLARENRFKAMFEIKPIRENFKRAPLTSWFALFITLLFALPLYLLKIELAPKEVAWLPSLIFVMFIFPARLLVGWALYRAQIHQQYSHWIFRWMSKFATLPILVAYIILIYITQYLSWYGSYSLLEQHAFLVPAPWMGL